MLYDKKVKVYKQGGTSITIPTSFCSMLDINPGDELTLTLDTERRRISIFKKENMDDFQQRLIMEKIIKAFSKDGLNAIKNLSVDKDGHVNFNVCEFNGIKKEN